jgi:drug/metabolite transporter (DMT)-like permease
MHLVIASASWSMSFLFIKLMNGDLPPLVLACLRAVIGMLGLLPIVLWMGQSILPKGREWRDWAIIGTLNGWVPNILVAFALERMDSGPAALIQASGPFMNALLAHWLLTGEKLTPQRIAGLVIGIIGVALLIGPSALSGGATLLGILAMFGLTLCYAVANIYVRRIPTADPMRLALGQQSFSAVFATPLALGIVGAGAFAAVPQHAGAVIGLGLIATALPILLYMRLLRAAGPAKSSMTGYLVPLFAIMIGVTVLGETLLLRQMIGGAIVMLGIAIVTGALRLPSFQRTPA